MDDLLKTLRISGAGMKAQGARLRVISENIANADSLGSRPTELPYRRQTVVFKNELDKSVGVDTVRVKKIAKDMSEFDKRFDPNHPAADADGYVLVPNVNRLVEMMDMKEAQRSYDANLSVVRSSKAMLSGAIDVLK